jgi:hypothetical protein
MSSLWGQLVEDIASLSQRLAASRSERRSSDVANLVHTAKFLQAFVKEEFQVQTKPGI